MITDTVKKVKLYRIALAIEQQAEKIASRLRFSLTGSQYADNLRKELFDKYEVDIVVQYKYEVEHIDTYIISIGGVYGVRIDIEKGDLYV